MCSLESLKIDLKGLKDGKTTVEYSLHDTYFEAIEAPEVRRGDVLVSLEINKVGALFELGFHTEGTVKVPCDMCLDDMELPISADNRLAARFGEENAEEDDVIIVAEDEGILDVSWLIYEFIVLAIPIKHVHAPGLCNPLMMKTLEEHMAGRGGDKAAEKPTDPRWEKLKEVKIED